MGQAPERAEPWTLLCRGVLVVGLCQPQKAWPFSEAPCSLLHRDPTTDAIMEVSVFSFSHSNLANTVQRAQRESSKHSNKAVTTKSARFDAASKYLIFKMVCLAHWTPLQGPAQMEPGAHGPRGRRLRPWTHRIITETQKPGADTTPRSAAGRAPQWDSQGEL